MARGPVLAPPPAGPAISLPNMLVLVRVMGARKTPAPRAILVAAATCAGMIFGAVQPSGTVLTREPDRFRQKELAHWPAPQNLIQAL
jgi:hypothetical protein